MENLINDRWMPFRTMDGGIRHGTPGLIADPDVVDVAFPRADFHGAAWQFLIGLLQTTCAPDDHEEWEAWWREPPDEGALQDRFSTCRHAFQVFGDGPRFMQDYDPMQDARAASVSTLLIEAPGNQGIKFNTDHFVKRGVGEEMCPRCAAIALFTMQINAPSGGKGYRTGLRGGGPLTTLVLPENDNEPLWCKLWLNVLPEEAFGGLGVTEPMDLESWRVFPWLAPTRVSETAGSDTTPEDVHPLHMYWAMPRRFRLLREDERCACQVCGEQTEQRVRQVRAKNYGYNYTGHWQHPLTPYRIDPKKPEQAPLSLKGQQGGLGYRHWESLVLEDHKERGNLPAAVVQDYPAKAREIRDAGPRRVRARLWVFGYDMDNMKARGWYATYMPLLAVSNQDGSRDRLLSWVDTMTAAAANAAWQVRSGVKAAWYTRPGDASGDFSFIDQRFWEATEQPFYACVSDLARALPAYGEAPMPEAIAERWYRTVRSQAIAVFDGLALAGEAEALDMKRVVVARNSLQRKLLGSKEMKRLRAWAALDDPDRASRQTASHTEGEAT